ncbi:rhamnulokinase [Actinomyces sp. Chiba101]|uniref:rhamnulokinase n=1 Tax=Actinomyces TaxID=1654 RepID=UPI000974F46F|nr:MULTISPECIES: rhamnulokinase family protein [Actinomyces]BAW92713.1 rhamnulokinase [Actinomyces sp. Chiba101]GAV94322.1 rhamnulokinase [Actinomyces denticolens]SUU07474.1 Rhamnulokinase [Actinomyces denticolens]
MTSSGPIRIGAIDLGPSTGRVIVGTIDEGRITLTETRRFPNSAIPLPTRAGERLYWDLLRLWSEIRQGLLAAVRDVGPLSAIGVDAWGMDYGLVTGDGVPAGLVSAYNSTRTQGMPERLFEAIPASELYRINGLQVQEFTTVFQLMAENREGGLPTPGNGLPSRTLLLLPDLITCWLTGSMYAEVTNASTTGLVDTRTRSWSRPLVERLRTEMGLDLAGLLPETIEPGTIVGPVRRDALEVFGPDGAPTPVVAVGSNDTASAVVAVPAENEDIAYISCGTWSVVGLELDRAVLTEASRRANFSNELGVDGTVRYLKSVMGLWVLDEAVRAWGEQGLEVSLAELDAAAEASEPLRTVVDIDDRIFVAPGDMAARIDDAARATGQPRPRSIGEYARCVNESLALAYRRAVREAAALSGKRVGALHLVGGGVRNRLLCQLAADATGLPVVAGPVEATALGSIVVAARGAGLISGDLAQLRELVRASSDITRYAPDPAAAPAWDGVERRLFGELQPRP